MTTSTSAFAAIRRHGRLAGALGFCVLAIAAVAGQPGGVKPQPIEPLIEAFVTVMPSGTMSAVDMTAYQRAEGAHLVPVELGVDYALAGAP